MARALGPITLFVTMENQTHGRLAQLVRAPALQAGGPRFESVTAHHLRSITYPKIRSHGRSREDLSGCVGGLPALLQLMQPPVETAPVEQRPVISRFADFALMQHHDPVRCLNRR